MKVDLIYQIFQTYNTQQKKPINIKIKTYEKKNFNFLFEYVVILLNMMDIKNYIFYRSLTFQVSNLRQQALVNPSPLTTSCDQFVIHHKQ